MENITTAGKIQSQYQELQIKEEDGIYSWGITDALLPTFWQQIPQSLYLSILRFTKNEGYIKQVFIYEKLIFNQIPNSPAVDYVHGSGGLQRKKACIIVCKAVVADDMFEVIEIPFAGDVIKKGLFFDLKQAIEIAYLLSY